MMNERQLDSFMSRIEESGDCWLWRGCCYPNGYGQVRKFLAHRVSYEHFKGEIPQGLEIHHGCFVKNCVNPDHLFAVTHSENILANSPPRCPSGHEFDAENTAYKANGDRYCKSCNRTRARLAMRVRAARLRAVAA